MTPLPVGFGVIFNPHRPQKRDRSGNSAEHLGQGDVLAESDSVIRTNERPPHRPQNLTPSANREWQLVHATIPGITLDCILLLPLPCDGVG